MVTSAVSTMGPLLVYAGCSPVLLSVDHTSRDISNLTLFLIMIAPHLHQVRRIRVRGLVVIKVPSVLASLLCSPVAAWFVGLSLWDRRGCAP